MNVLMKRQVRIDLFNDVIKIKYQASQKEVRKSGIKQAYLAQPRLDLPSCEQG